MSEKQQKKMDSRCLMKLDNLPTNYCPLAVQRLKALRHAGKELTEEEEAKIPGCPWAVSHQLANYCFFKLVEDFLPEEKSFSDMEIAHFLSVSTDTVKKVEKKALQRIKSSPIFKEIIDTHNGDQIMEEVIDFRESDYSKE